MKKYILLVVYVFLLFHGRTQDVVAGETQEYDVEISVLSEKELYKKKFVAEVGVTFNSHQIYNDNIYLSYHIFRNNEQEELELIEFENQRKKVQLNEQGTGIVLFEIELEDEIGDEVVIQFDLVDENKAIWFSHCKDISFLVDSLVVSDMPFIAQWMNLEDAVLDAPLVFATNVLFFVGVVCVYVYARKKKIFEW